MSSRFPGVTQGMERFSLDLSQAAKNRVCVLEVEVVVCLDRECMEFVIAGCYKAKFYDFKI